MEMLSKRIEEKKAKQKLNHIPLEEKKATSFVKQSNPLNSA